MADNAASREEYEERLESARLTGDNAQAARALYELAYLDYQARQWDRAAAQYDECAQHAGAAGDASLQAQALFELGATEEARNNLQAAREALERAFDTAESAE